MAIQCYLGYSSYLQSSREVSVLATALATSKAAWTVGAGASDGMCRAPVITVALQ